MRQVIVFNENWTFTKPGNAPIPVRLPHTWNAQDGQDGGNDYWRGTAVYEKEFFRPDWFGEIVLEFAGAAMSADVFVNGAQLAHHDGGYSTFRVNITDALVPGNNKVTVSVDNSENDRVYPQKADFTFYGGLYRDVQLLLLPPEHFEVCKDGTPGIKVTPVVKGSAAEVTVETWQNGEGTVSFRFGDEVYTAESRNGHASVTFPIENVHLWDGVNDPYLYSIEAQFGEDVIAARFGCRSFSFDPDKGFLLNGHSYPLRGVSRHQDFLGVGNAITLQEQTLDMELIREIGANTIRLAHYQHAQEFYDLCDEYGMIVWAEIPYITEHMPNGRQNTLDQMRELITQCYNHPSIVCWGLSNEVAVHGITEDLMQNHILLNDLCHEMDKTRPTTMAHPFMLEHESPLIQITDIGSYNLYFGWYMGTLEQNDSFFDEYHEKYPKRIMGFSEYGADANVRFQTAHPEQGDYSEQYQCLYHESLLGTIRRHPWMWATHLWNMFDFAADGRDEGGAHGLNQKGLVTFDRKIKKDAFYLYKATWNKEEPFVHICGRRYVDRTEQETEVRVYSNQHQVTLMVDGQKVDELEGETVFVFKLPISGRHTVKAVADSCQDEITVCKVDRPNKAYCLGKTGSVSNWFDEAEFKSDHYSIRDSFGVLMAHPQAGKLVGDLMHKIVESRGDVAKTAHKNPNLQKMLAGMSFQALLKQAGDSVSEATCKELNAALQKIPK
mgnify:FL=1